MTKATFNPVLAESEYPNTMTSWPNIFRSDTYNQGKRPINLYWLEKVLVEGQVR